MPWPVALAIVITLQAVSIWLLPSLRLNNSPEVYYPPGSPAVVLRDALRRDFPSDELLTVVFQGDDLFSLQFLRRLDALSTRLAENPLVDRVTSMTTMEHISGTADGFAVGRLIDVGRLRKDDPAAVRARVMADRFAPGLLVSKDGTVTALVVRPKLLSESADRLVLKVAVAAAINEAGLRRYYAGDAGPLTLDVAQLQSILQDSMFFVPATTVLGLGLLAWVVGRLRPVVIGGLAMATVVQPMIAAIAWSGQPYTMASAILPSLLAAYTFATLLHLYAGVQKAQLAGLRRSECVDRALSETFKPGLYNVLTTGAGLLSLGVRPDSADPGLRRCRCLWYRPGVSDRVRARAAIPDALGQPPLAVARLGNGALRPHRVADFHVQHAPPEVDPARRRPRTGGSRPAAPRCQGRIRCAGILQARARGEPACATDRVQARRHHHPGDFAARRWPRQPQTGRSAGGDPRLPALARNAARSRPGNILRRPGRRDELGHERREPQVQGSAVVRPTAQPVPVDLRRRRSARVRESGNTSAPGWWRP
jgi:hypothetical protein